jgi:hypothetical protein
MQALENCNLMLGLLARLVVYLLYVLRRLASSNKLTRTESWNMCGRKMEETVRKIIGTAKENQERLSKT